MDGWLRVVPEGGFPDVPDESLDPLDPYAWLDDSACADEELSTFFGGKGGNGEAAKKVCSGCPVRVQCVTHAYESEAEDGIFGGLSPSQRRGMDLATALVFITVPEVRKPRRGSRPLAPVIPIEPVAAPLPMVAEDEPLRDPIPFPRRTPVEEQDRAGGGTAPVFPLHGRPAAPLVAPVRRSSPKTKTAPWLVPAPAASAPAAEAVPMTAPLRAPLRRSA